jgi:glucarate dehydratase
MHEDYLRCGITERDDTAYMRSVEPTWEKRRPKW